MNATELHLSDADIIRYLDREGGAVEGARQDAHLRACDDCAGRLRAFEHRSALVSRWLEEADAPHEPAAPPEWLTGARRPRRLRAAGAASPWLRAAIIVLLLAAPLAALQPVRQWVAERVGLAEPSPDPTLTTAAAHEDPAALRFTPAPGRFTVRLDGAAPGATLRLERAAGAEAVLRGSAGLALPPVVSDDAVRLPAGDAAAGRSFTLALPATVDELVLVIADRSISIPAAELDAGVVLGLGGEAGL